MDAIVFIGQVNSSSYKELKNIVCPNIEIYWAHSIYDSRKDISEKEFNKYKHIEYNPEDIEYRHHEGFYNYTDILNDPRLAQYDYVYLTHDSNHYTGKWSSLINMLSTSDADLIAPKIIKYNNGPVSSWMWINMYINNTETKDLYSCYLGAYIRFMRISRKALKFYNEHSDNDMKNSAFYEMSVPTILYNNGFKCESLDTDLSDKEFHNKNIECTNAETFNSGVSVSSAVAKKHVRNMKRDVLCSSWKSKSSNVILDEYYIDSIVEAPVYSIVVPVYNNADTLEASLNSIYASNTSMPYEVIVVNESSTDDSYSIIEKYSVHYIVKEHTGVADTINAGIRYAKGKYIFVHMPNAIMHPDRLDSQSKHMTDNSYVMSLCSTSENPQNNVMLQHADAFDENIVFDLGGLCVCDVVKTSAILLEEYYKDHLRKFVALLTANGYSCGRCKACYEEYVSGYVRTTDVDYKYVYKCYNWKCDNPELTAIITFRNEKDEVEKTVQSIRATANNINILLVNDNSNDNINYEHVAEFYGCDYIKHSQSIGCGPSRDDGVAHCKTPYFILLDSHMRFYEMGWDDRLVSLIKEYPGCIISANTSIISRDSEGYYTNEDGMGPKATTMCARLNTDEAYLFDVKWISKPVAKTQHNDLYEIYCVLGAGYCSSVEHWNNIGGLKGLSIYGLDEALMSYKTWALGGKCYILHDLRIGHIYRPASPFPNTSDVLESARIACYYMFCEDKDLDRRLNTLKSRIGKTTYNSAYSLFLKRKDICDDVKKNVCSKFIRNLNEFIMLNDIIKNKK